MARSNYKLPCVADGAQADHEYDEYMSSDEAQLQSTESSPPHKNLKKFRLEKKYKKQEMATFMRVTSRTYYAYEEGLRAIPSNALTSLAATTDVDLHFILTGRKATNDAQTVRIAIADAHIIDRQLTSRYPDMDTATRGKVANELLTTDWGDWPRMHPDIIEAAVFRITGYRYFPEDMPSPPFFEDYVDPVQYELDVRAWQSLVKEDGAGG